MGIDISIRVKFRAFGFDITTIKRRENATRELDRLPELVSSAIRIGVKANRKLVLFNAAGVYVAFLNSNDSNDS